jgi:archaeal chaperonin
MNSNQVQPIFILPEGTQRTTGKTAQRNNIMAAKLVAEAIRTTLGPKGMDKMIVDGMGDVMVTNDGVTILQEMNVEHPAAKMLVAVAKTQEEEVGDGTTTAVVLAGEFLKQAEDLLDKEVHPTMIARGYRLAAQEANKILHTIAQPITEHDSEILKNLAITAITGKGAEASKHTLARLGVQAVKSVLTKTDEKLRIDLDHIKLEKKVGGSVDDSELIQGLVIDKGAVHPSMPKKVVHAKIALLDVPIEIRNTEFDAKISITNPEQMQAFLDQEEKMIRDMADKIIASGATVVFCQKGIDDIAQHFLAKHNILAARRVTKSDMEALARATGATIISNLVDLTSNDFGSGSVEERKISDDDVLYVTDCPQARSVTIIIKGGTEHVVDEVKRAMTDALGDIAAALTGKGIVTGAGATEIEVARQLRKFAEGLSGREQLAVQAFANALEIIPRTLAENAGLDPIDVITELKAAHDRGEVSAGIDVFTGKVSDAKEKGVIEPLKIKTQAFSAAAEVAQMILRIDDVIAGSKAKPQMMPPGMHGM